MQIAMKRKYFVAVLAALCLTVITPAKISAQALPLAEKPMEGPRVQLEVELTEGTNMAVSLSPDGAQLILAVQGVLWSLPVTGGEAVPLTMPEMEAYEPAWSPRGDLVAFYSYFEDAFAVWTMHPDGSNLTQLTQGVGDARYPSFSPDGAQVVYSSDEEGGYSVWSVDLASGERSKLIDAAETGYRHPTGPYFSGEGNAIYPTLSPDGSTLAFVVDGEQDQLVVQELETDKEFRTLYKASILGAPLWSPDGDALYVVGIAGAGSHLARVSVDGTGSQTLVDEGDVFPFRPSLDVDGTLYYTGNGGVQTLSATGEERGSVAFSATVVLDRTPYQRRSYNLAQRTPLPALGIIDPVLSPDASRVAFAALGDLWLADLTTSETRRLTDDAHVDLSPNWSPDGSRLAFASDRGGKSDIWIMDLGSGALNRLTDSTMPANAPVWSPDGDRIAYLADTGQSVFISAAVVVADIVSGEEKVISDAIFGPSAPAWSPDGSVVAVYQRKPMNSRFRAGLNAIRLLPATGEGDRRSMVAGTSFEGSTAFDGRSSTSSWGGFQALGADARIASNGVPITDAAGNFLVQPLSLSGCSYQVSSDLCYASGIVTDASKRDLRAESRMMDGYTVLPSADRFNAFTFMNYDLSPGLSAFAELGYYEAETDAISSAPSSLASTPIVMPATAYWNPFGPVGSPNRLPGLNIPDEGLPIQIRSYSFHDFGPRPINVKNDQTRVLGGLRGEAFVWSWESALLYNEATVKDSQAHASSTLVQQALAMTTPDAYNPFLGGDTSWFSNPMPGSENHAATIDSFRITAVRENTTSLAMWDFKVSKPDILSLPGGDVGVAGGIELRNEKYEDNRDSRQDLSTNYTDLVTGITYGSDLMGHSPSPDVEGERKVTSAYLELGIPVVSPEMNLPFMEAIDVQVAGRYEDYDDVGSVAKPKIAASWDIIEGVRLRGSWSEGFKAPNLEVLNTPLLERLDTRTDYVKCEADLRAHRISSFSQCTQRYGIPGLRQGNADLVPEESESFSYGLVVEPHFIPSQWGTLTLTVDRWKIEQTGIVGVLNEQSAINLDYLARLQGGVNPNVVRAAPTPADIVAIEGTGITPVGEVTHINSAFTNLQPLEVGGIDFGVVYDKDFMNLGDLRVSLNVSKLKEFFQSPNADQQILLDAKAAGLINEGVAITGAADLIGQSGNPELKWTLSATWNNGPWQIGFMTQYTDEVIQPTVLDADLNPWVVDSLQTYNLYRQYRLLSNFSGETSLRVGARNITDEDPPLASGGYLGNIHQPQGRYAYASVSHKF